MSIKKLAITILLAAILTTLTFIIFEDFVLEPNREDDIGVSDDKVVGDGVDIIIGEGVPLEDQVTTVNPSLLVLPVFGGFMVGIAYLIQRNSGKE